PGVGAGVRRAPRFGDAGIARVPCGCGIGVAARVVRRLRAGLGRPIRCAVAAAGRGTEQRRAEQRAPRKVPERRSAEAAPIRDASYHYHWKIVRRSLRREDLRAGVARIEIRCPPNLALALWTLSYCPQPMVHNAFVRPLFKQLLTIFPRQRASASVEAPLDPPCSLRSSTGDRSGARRDASGRFACLAGAGALVLAACSNEPASPGTGGTSSGSGGTTAS